MCAVLFAAFDCSFRTHTLQPSKRRLWIFQQQSSRAFKGEKEVFSSYSLWLFLSITFSIDSAVISYHLVEKYLKSSDDFLFRVLLLCGKCFIKYFFKLMKCNVFNINKIFIFFAYENRTKSFFVNCTKSSFLNLIYSSSNLK